MSYAQDPDIVENWKYPIPVEEKTELYKLLQVSSKENKRINLDIETIYNNRFVTSATGDELEKIGELVGVRRKTAEGDKKLRKRIRGEFAAQASDTTFETFAVAALSILDADPDNISIEKPPTTVDKVVNLYVDGGILDDNPLSNTEITDLLDRTVSAGAKVNLIETGTFAFAGDNTNLKGWDDGTWSSTIN
jgi:hypothetical protein